MNNINMYTYLPKYYTDEKTIERKVKNQTNI